MMRVLPLVLLLASCWTAQAEVKQVRVFVALCDNKTQGIMPVGEKIGNGDDPANNLYWGCSDGFDTYFKRSRQWKTVGSKKDVSNTLMRQVHLKHVGGDIELIATAYRGSQIKQCLIDFEKAAASNDHDLVAFIGHNGLMDFKIPVTPPVKGNDTDVIVLACKSDAYFSQRLRELGCRPVLMTRQLMYPGSFLLHDAIESWKGGGSLKDIRAAAGRAYAKNQKISVKAATGVFAKREE